VYKKYVFFLGLMSLAGVKTAINQYEKLCISSLIPFEIQVYIFSFLPEKKQVTAISLLSDTFNKLIKKDEKYWSFFKKNVIDDIKGQLFNAEIAQIHERYEEIYKKYFFSYVKPIALNFSYENTKKNKLISFEIIELLNKKSLSTKVLQLFKVIIDKKNIGNILVLKEPVWNAYYLNEIENIKRKSTYNDVKRIVLEENWYPEYFKSIYNHVLIDMKFPLELVQLPGIKFKSSVQKIVKNNPNLKKIFLPGNAFADDVTLCNDKRFIPCKICNLFHICEENKDVIFPYFIHHNFAFDLLLEVVKSKNTFWLQKLQTTYDLNINMLSHKGYTLLEKAVPDKSFISFILKHGGDINRKNVYNKTVFDKVILKIINKNYMGELLQYYELYLFLDLYGAQQCQTSVKNVEKVEKQLKKYYFQTYEDILR